MKINKILGIILIFTVIQFLFSYFIVINNRFAEDSYDYLQILQKLAGEVPDWPESSHTANFLYPLLTLPIYKLTRNADLSFSFISFMFYLFLGFSCYKLCKALKFDDKITLAISLLIISHPLIVGYSNIHVTDVPSFVLSIFTLYVFFSSDSVFYNGLIFGLTLITRSQYFLLFPIYFFKFNLKQFISIMLISSAITVSVGLISNAPLHPIHQYFTAKATAFGFYAQKSERIARLVESWSNPYSGLAYTFIGVTAAFFYHMLFLIIGFIEDKGLQKKVLSTILLPGLIMLYLWPVKHQRFFMILIAPMTIWATMGIAKFAKQTDKRLFWVIVSLLIVINDIGALLFFLIIRYIKFNIGPA